MNYMQLAFRAYNLGLRNAKEEVELTAIELERIINEWVYEVIDEEENEG